MSKHNNKPVRILQVVTIMNRGGLETMLMNYYRNIDRDKIQFDFIVHRSERGAYDDEIESMGGRIYKFQPISFKNIFKYKKDLLSFLKSHPEYTIVHSHIDSLSAVPLYIAKKAGIKTRIAHSHTSNFDKNYKTVIRSITKKFIKYTATDFAGCSKEAVHFMFGDSIKNYTVINNAIDVEKFKYSPSKRQKVRKMLNIPKGTFVVGHVGSFTYPKNHEFLIEVFNEIHKSNSNSLLLLVGTGKLQESIQNKVHIMGLSHSVMFLGSRSDIPDLMQAMDVFVMPSRYEGLPVVSIEAQSSGLSCFFSDVVTTDLNITQNCEFISLSQGFDKWASAILKSENTTRRNTISKIIVGGYSVNDNLRLLFEIYRIKQEVC